ncbi:metallophosphoesterase family protein [Miltoncostaea oceani]|uniref:metallophosphoesterase family protein n=1 Tax=Miltoncostaea oceani TaxID=2843216 RepID=UPI001C3DDC8D|nr:metallophosphoesterase family protein [Miltoncostaea oceani]
MKLAVLSDTHANPLALEAVLSDAHSRGVDEVWHLGDAVDWGWDPETVVTRLREEVSLNLAGNHDLLVLGKTDPEPFSEASHESSRYSFPRLSGESRAYLDTLAPLQERGDLDLVACHGSPVDPVWGYSDTNKAAESTFAAQGARLVVCGHTHLPRAHRERADTTRRRVRLYDTRPMVPFDLADHRWQLNAGSVGMPRGTRDPRAQWLLLDLAANSAMLVATTYDARAARAAMLGAGLGSDWAKMIPVG